MWAGRFLPCEVVTEWQSEQYESVTNVPSLTPRPRLCVSVMTHTPLLSRTSLSVNITAMKRRPVSVGPSLLAHKLIHIVTFSQATGQNCSVQKQEAAVLRCGTLLWEWNLFKVLAAQLRGRASVWAQWVWELLLSSRTLSVVADKSVTQNYMFLLGRGRDKLAVIRK